MKLSAIRPSIVSVILFASILFLASPPVTGASTVQFKLLHDVFVVIPVYVNGTGPFDFLLDTGTNTSVIDPELAHALSLKPVDRLLITTPNDTTAVPRAWLDKVAIGGKRVDNLEVVITDLKNICQVAPKARGVVGQNFLRSVNYLLDYQHHRIDFDEAGEIVQKLKGNRIPVQDEEGKSLIKASQGLKEGNRRDNYLQFVLDSGASTLIVFNVNRADLNIETNSFGSDFGQLSSGIRTCLAETTILRFLRIGDQNLSRLPVILARVGDGYRNQTEKGLMPTSLFHSIYFNNAKAYVILNPVMER